VPTLAKAQLTEPESPWGAAFDQMYLSLCRDRVPILTALDFRRTDLPVPEENSSTIPTKDEERGIASNSQRAHVAAAASEELCLPAYWSPHFKKVSKQPSLFLARELPQPVEWALADDYQRGDEPPGTHWRDVWGDQVAAFPGQVETADEANIAKAADAAIARIQRKACRPYNEADQILAVSWAQFFAAADTRFAAAASPLCAGEAV